jgi:Peptidase family M28
MTADVTAQDAQYALDLVRRICTEVGPGLPGTPQERERAAILQDELESHLGAENVAMEEFTLAPDALLTTYPAVLCMLAAVLLNLGTGRISGISPWATSIAALILSLFMPLLFVLEYVLSLEVTDRFFPKRQSINLVGRLRRPGAEKVSRLLILSGHHDSAPENTWLRFTGYGFYPFAVTFLLGMITLVILCLLQVIGLILGSEAVIRSGTLGWVLLVYPTLPSMVFALFLTRGHKGGGIVPGAADNLSASAAAVAMCRFLVRNPDQIPAETEIRFISFGSEEAGVRGSRRYVERHLEDLKRLDARVLNYEVIAHPEITIFELDFNGTVRNSPEMVRSVVAAAGRAGVPHKQGAAAFGLGTDAAPFSRAGLKATTLFPFKMPEQLFAFYHQSRDTPEVLTIEPLLNVLKLTLEWVRSGGE